MAKINSHLNWSELAFKNKKPLNELKPTFIAAPREMSTKRFVQLVKRYLPAGNILVGLSKEPYVLGLENQTQFKMLDRLAIDNVISKVNAASKTNKIYTLEYSQRDLKYILEKITFKKVVLVNGSWYTAFHLRPEYYVLAERRLNYEYVSPFASEQEALDYPGTVKLPELPLNGDFTVKQMFEIVALAAKHSFDYGGFQTAAALGRKKGGKYELLATSHNKVVPYETYAMHYGASRERNFSPPNDLNHYDTVHAEVELLIAAQRKRLDLKGATLFINLLPCPTCGRMLAETDIDGIIYRDDHSAGYTLDILSKARKNVWRLE